MSLVLEVRKIMEACEQRGPHQQYSRHGPHGPGGKLGVVLVAKLGQTKLFKGRAREVEPTCAADLVFTVNMVHVRVGSVVNALPGLFDKLRMAGVAEL